jgi:TolB-like protein/DNA-binding winged helix-turn-helix (wHTH) protein/Tfp pilus assembly protein PilF
VRFGAFTADLQTGELVKNGTKIRLQVQPFQVLVLLLRRAGEMVTREELREKLWPENTFVDFDDGLNTAIRKLRQVLGDSADHPKYIETLPRRGYRFIGSLSDASTSKANAVPALSELVIEQQSSAASEGVVTSPAASETHRRWKLWATAAAMVGLVVLVGVLLLLARLDAGGWRENFLARAATIHIRSIAVLPLENLSGDTAQEYFVDGMTDALVSELAHISSLNVISRTSSMRYKGTHKPLPEIARELNVDGIVEGSVVQSSERVRVNAHLIQAATDRHLWTGIYERNLGDAVVLQSEVAQAIANAIQLQLTPQEQARLARKQSVDPQAYEFYLRGRYFWNKFTDAGVLKSIDYFQQAIQRDPNDALAYAGMADAYTVRTDLSPKEQSSKSKAMARTALQIDEGLAEAHNALAANLFWYDWDWAGAEKEFLRAIALNSNYAMAHQWYGQFQRAMGRQNWAAEVKRAHELDPLSLVIAGGAWYANSGRYDLWIDNLRKKLELDPKFALGYSQLGGVYMQKGMYPEAIAQFQKGVKLSDGAPDDLSTLGYAYGMSGKRREALKIVQQLSLLSKRRYVSPYEVAMIYVGLREKDLAFDWLQKVMADRYYKLVWLKYERRMDPIRSDPRYDELIRQVGLPE